MNVKVSRNDNTCEVEVSAEIPADLLARYRTEALKELKRTVEIDGFRKGTAPEEIVLKRIGEEALLRKAAEDAVQEELPKLFAAEKLLVIAAPQVSLEMPKQGSPLRFSARAPLAPSVTLPDYKKISGRYSTPARPMEATDAEVEDALRHLRRERKRIELMEQGTAPEQAAEQARKIDVMELPALDDVFVQSLGFENVQTFTESVRKNIGIEKSRREEEKRRAMLLDDLVKEARIALPAVMLEWELDDLEAQFKNDLARQGADFSNYLKQLNKTREDIRAMWADTARKRIRTRLVLDAIAAKETIEPPADAVAHEVEHLKEHYPSADPANLTAFVRRSMRTEMTIRFLEGKEPTLPREAHEH